MDTVPMWAALLAAGALGMFLMKAISSFRAYCKKGAEECRKIKDQAWEGHIAKQEIWSIKHRLTALEAMPHNQWKPNK